MSSSIPRLALAYVEATSRAGALAQKIATELAQERLAAEAKVPAVCKALKTAQLVEDHEIKLATEQLSNPADALDILVETVRHYQKKMAEKTASAQDVLGSPDNTESAPLDKHANYVGYRRGDLDGLSPADLALVRGLGIR